MISHSKHNREPLIHLTRRLNVSQGYAWGIRIVAFILSILVCAIVTSILTDRITFASFFQYFTRGTFGTAQNAWVIFRDTAVLLLLALAVTPCFKMRYWNIGGEGQALMGALGAAVAISQFRTVMPLPALILVALAFAIAFAIVWAVIPALFKAQWNTNETLLTLMFNYIAGCLGAYFIKKVSPRGTGSLTFLKYIGDVGKIGDNEFAMIIIIVAVITVLMAVYLKYSKHGYELSVVGESPNTARYVGIHNKAVVIRTLVLCGLLCGVAGFLLVCLKDHAFKAQTATQTTLGGLGFTAVLVSWLAHFNPLAMVLTAFLVAFISRGATGVKTPGRLGDSYASMMVGIFFFFIIATEFFINFKISFRSRGEIPREPDDLPDRPEDKPTPLGAQA
ncbi:MAG: ABC transporter permease [Clostridia bacterium]|nr:ABC transporter permease [Clostridia bacterium]